jgi:hypothetical protein
MIDFRLSQFLGPFSRRRCRKNSPERLVMPITPGQAHDRALKAAAAFRRSFLDRAGGDVDLAERLRSEHYREMGRRSAARRRAKAEARRAQLERTARELGIVTEAEFLALLSRPQRKR